MVKEMSYEEQLSYMNEDGLRDECKRLKVEIDKLMKRQLEEPVCNPTKVAVLARSQYGALILARHEEIIFQKLLDDVKNDIKRYEAELKKD